MLLQSAQGNAGPCCLRLWTKGVMTTSGRQPPKQKTPRSLCRVPLHVTLSSSARAWAPGTRVGRLGRAPQERARCGGSESADTCPRPALTFTSLLPQGSFGLSSPNGSSQPGRLSCVRADSHCITVHLDLTQSIVGEKKPLLAPFSQFNFHLIRLFPQVVA